MKNAIITGGAGFVASHLAEHVDYRYDKIYLVDNLVRSGNLRNIQHLLANPKFEFIHADIADFDFAACKDVAMVYHLAATRINRCVKFKREGHKGIADGGFNVVDYCARVGARLFFASSASVYASPKSFPIYENDPCLPPTLYGSGKLYTEHLMHNYYKMSGLRYAINRFFSVYGPRMDCEGAYTEVIYNWLSKIHKGEREITVYGDPDEKVLDLVFVDDVVCAIDLTSQLCNNQAYNVSTQYGTTLTQLIQVVEKVTGTRLKVNSLPENRTDIEKKRVGDTTALRQTGWTHRIGIEEGIQRTYEWIKTL
jgi:UDP-glucose 4-epimerase